MTQHQISLILTFAAVLAYIVQICLVPFKTKKIMAQIGSLFMPLDNGTKTRVILLFVVSALVIAVVPFRNFAVWISAVLLLCGLFGENFAVKEACGLGKAGIYENGIISGNICIFFEEIYSFPTFAYEDKPDTYEVDWQTIQIMKNDNSSAVLVFDSKEKRQAAVAKILELHPEFKK